MGERLFATKKEERDIAVLAWRFVVMSRWHCEAMRAYEQWHMEMGDGIGWDV